MTKYLTEYMEKVARRLAECNNLAELEVILAEHLDKIAFMQHERIVHFLVTMMFSLILCLFAAVLIFKTSLEAAIIVLMVMVLVGFYIKHYFFLENTVQKMYKVYDEILAKKKSLKESVND